MRNAVYRDEKHAAVRALAVDALAGATVAGWQKQYRSGFRDGFIAPAAGEGLSKPDMLLQDAMTRARIHRALPESQWLTLMALYSADDAERVRAIQRLAELVGTNAGPLFKKWCIGVWALPALRRQAKQLADWDGNATPKGTLKDWRLKIKKELNGWHDAALEHLGRLLADGGLIAGRRGVGE